MDENAGLAKLFEENRSHLRAVAYRMLGSLSEADDAVQESWLRLNRSDAGSIENLGGWLTTVVARVCLDMLRSRQSRREESLDVPIPEQVAIRAGETDPEHEVLLADSVGIAMLVVLETLAPAERLAFVLHDMFAVPFEEIAPIVNRSSAATRQLASRARRRVQGATTDSDAERPAPDRTRQKEIVSAFLAAARDGDFNGLLAVLDPDVVLRADPAAVKWGASREVHGASVVARIYSGRAQEARQAVVNGVMGVVWAPGGELRVVFDFTIVNGKIVDIHLIADPESLRELEITILNE